MMAKASGDVTEHCLTTTAAALARAACLAGDEEAIVSGDQRITYRLLAQKVDLYARGLSTLGVTRGDHVGICLGNGVDWAALFLAIGSIGAVTVPVNTRLRADEIAYMLGQTRVSTLFVADRFLKIDFIDLLRKICPLVDTRLPDPALPSLTRIVVLGDDIPAGAIAFTTVLDAAMDQANIVPVCVADDDLLIQFTSGTTSFPKGVVLSHRSMLANAHFAGTRFGLRPGDRYLSPRPFFHVAGSTLSLLAALQHMATLVTVERFDAGEALAIAEKERTTLFSGNDTLFLMLLNHPDRETRKLSFRGGWAAASPSIVARAINELGMREVVVAYGLSEASPNIGMSAWWDSEDDRVNGLLRPQPGTEIRILDRDTGEPCPCGEIGEISVRGWNVMRCYFDKPDETAATLDGKGWLSTGDLGRMTDDGRLVFVGRLKDIVRVGGENVAPSDVENILHSHPAILQAQVVGVPDPRLIEVIAAFIVLRPGTVADPQEIIQWCGERMGGFKVPRYVRVVDNFEEIGMTASSKVQKGLLVTHAIKLLGLEPATVR